MHSEPFGNKTSWDRCKKHPGHKQFIPIRNLTCDLLPESYRSESLFNLIHFMADLTVCLHVKRVSSKRPSEYIFSNFRGKNTTHTGSGFVFRVGDMKDVSTLCDCSECKVQTGGFTSAKSQDIYTQTAGSKTPTLRTEVFIKTAAHVVFDNEEAKSTFIDVFYDDENDRQNSRLMHGYCIDSVDMENDISIIKCVTHDQAMSDRLRNSLEKFEKLQKRTFNTDIVRSVKSTDIMRAKNNEEAELESVEISVQFPDGEKSLHNIWLFGEPVKASKEFLLNQAGIMDVSPDQLVMVIKHSGMPDIVMSDDLDMQSYINNLTEAEYIEITRKDIVDDCHLLNLTL